ncbi:hypothetical protein DFH07DRAFT_287193 [Mycena maculata]|uniref:Uncharacterized protein n=1 Tax=Mycena maculata TaxID=230809 RepID=A0AAD7HKG5_9AGAR|nr:hypothetical protein DFH07DRAFT_287193 [Mycena maculata]
MPQVKRMLLTLVGNCRYEEIRSAHKISSKVVAKGGSRKRCKALQALSEPSNKDVGDLRECGFAAHRAAHEDTTKPRGVAYSLPADIRVLRGDGEVYLLMVLEWSEWRMADGGVHLGAGTGLSKKHHGSPGRIWTQWAILSYIVFSPGLANLSCHRTQA